jgi:glycosyltransferase involved in cell wall biosynthesis
MGKVKVTSYANKPSLNCKFSIVIPTLWKSDKLFAMLDIYEQSKYVSEVIIIDNDPMKRPKISHSKVKIHTRGQNIFVNPAWNWGVALSKNEDIIIANDDVIVRKLDLLLPKLHLNKYHLVGVDYENTRTDSKIKITEADKLTYGYGCFMYVRKSHYIQLPYNLKIWRGDFLLRKHILSGKFSGIYVETEMSTTVNEFKNKAYKDTLLYRKWKNTPKDLSVIIITYNRLKYTKKCIDTLTKYTHCNYFITIIDNGSTDGTVEYLKSLPIDNIMIILSEENLMPRRSNQIGLKLSFPSKHYLLCDNDGEFTKGWYEKATNIMSGSDIACLRKSRWLPTHKFTTITSINGIKCHPTRYIGSFSIMNHETRGLLIDNLRGLWIGKQIGEIAISNHKTCIQVADGYILDQSDNDMDNPEYREQYIELWKKKNRLNSFNRRIEILKIEQNAGDVIELKQHYNNTAKIHINKEKGIVIKEIISNEYKELIIREKYWLGILSDTGFVPQLLDHINNKLVLEYCGEVLTEDNAPRDLYEQLYNINIELLKHHCYYNDWKKGNVLVREDKIYLIDFGWCPKIIEDYTCGAVINTNRIKKKSGNYFTKIL